jgi:hypothetical protein
MAERGIKPIAQKFLENNYLFALEFREGFVFGRTIRRRICNYKPWSLIDSAGNAVEISPSSYSTEQRFRDPRSPEKEILYLDATTNAGLPWFMHGAFGIKPQQINMYLRFPEGQVIPGKFPNLNPIKPSDGDDFGYINSLNSPYEEPTDWVEVVLPPLTHISAEYYNKDPDRKIRPVLNILFAVYWVELFRPETHPDLISNIASRRYDGAKASFLTVGFGDYPESMGSTLISDWKVKPMTLEEARRLGGGR